MVKVVGVQFKKAGKIYYFDPDGYEIEYGTHVIVETSRGIEYGKVVIPNRDVPEGNIVSALKNVIRIATDEDTAKHKQNKEKEKEAFDICLKKIEVHHLKMKLVEVEYTFDNNKILFYFTAEGRIDFRELVKDLAAIFRTRIELRQIGVRDEAKILGGIGICGQELCCSTFLTEFQPVSIKMAKEQGLSLNPSKISGKCGRLRCCLKYEQGAYEDILQRVPRVGAIVETPEGVGTVMFVSVLKELLKVKLNKNQETDLREYKASDVKLIRNVESNPTDDELDMEALKRLEEEEIKYIR